MTSTPITDLLVESARSGGCPTCRVLARLLYEDMCRLQYEAVMDEAVRSVVTRDGLCGAHLWYLLDLASPVTVAEVVAPMLDRVAARARDLGESIMRDAVLVRRGNAALGRSFSEADCLACQSIRAWEVEIAEALAPLLADDGLRALGGGLCAPHLVQMLVRLPVEVASRLLTVWANRSAALASRLSSAAGGPARNVPPALPTEAVGRLAGSRGAGRAPR